MNKKEKQVRVLIHPSEIAGLAFWRLLWPFYQLAMRQEVVYSVINNYLLDGLPYLNSDVIIFQRSSGKQTFDYIEYISAFKKQANFKVIYDVDDILFFDEVPDYHYGKKNISLEKNKKKADQKIKERYDNDEYTKKIIESCDEVTVSTPFLKEYYLEKTNQKNITVLPNKIPFFWAGALYSEALLLRNYRKHKSRPRILYAGSSSHADVELINKGKDDFSAVIDCIIKTRKEFCWIFLGTCPSQIKEYTQTKEIEFFSWSTIGLLPQNIAEREGSMMVAPLADNLFNHGKSNIKFLEACAYGLPIACQNITPYKDAPIKFNTGEEMIEKIRQTLKTEDTFIEQSRKARQIADMNWLEVEQNIAMYRDIYKYPYGDPRRPN